MSSRIQLRRGTAAQWSQANPVLAAGEVGVESDSVPVRIKIGDGLSVWTNLGYAAGAGLDILMIIDPLLFDPSTGTLSVNVNEIVDAGNF